MDLVEHAVQPLEDEDEGGADGLGRPVGDGQHLHDVALQASAFHGQGVVGRQLQQGVGDLRQPGAETLTHCDFKVVFEALKSTATGTCCTFRVLEIVYVRKQLY